jgi:hypothetical protein
MEMLAALKIFHEISMRLGRLGERIKFANPQPEMLSLPGGSRWL